MILINGQPDHNRILDRDQLLVTTVGTYVEWHYIEHFSANKCQNFKWRGLTLWGVLVPYNVMKGFSSVPCERGYFFSEKNGFLINISHKTAAEIDESDECDNGVFLPLFLSLRRYQCLGVGVMSSV